MAALPVRDTGISDITSLVELFRGKGSTSTTSEEVSADKANALVKSILEGSSGLATVASGEKTAGLYNSTVKTQLANDLIARTAAQTAAQSKTTTTTNATAPALNPANTLKALGASALLSPIVSGAKKKLGLDKAGEGIFDSIFGTAAGGPDAVSALVGGKTVTAGGAGASAAAISAQAAAEGQTSLAEFGGKEASFSGSGGGSSGADVAAAGGGGAYAGSLTAEDLALTPGADGAILGDAAMSSAEYASGVAELQGVGGAGAELFGATEGAGLVEGGLGAAEAAGGFEELVLAAAAWIVCTELNKQRRLPTRYYIYGAREFATYPENGKKGYYIWAIPSVKHLRKYPNSLYSKFMELIFNRRAEYLSAKAGCKGARKTAVGAVITHGLYYFCLGLSYLVPGEPYSYQQVTNIKTEV